MDDTDNLKVLYECQCGEEAITVELWQEDDVKEIWLSYWQHGHFLARCKCWKCRIRGAWHYIRYGHPYADMVSLTLEQAMLLANSIHDCIEGTMLQRTVSDGFGSVWPAKCEKCGSEIVVVRPGDARCMECDVPEDDGE